MNHLEHEDGAPRRIESVTAWASTRKDVATAFQSVTGPLPSGERCPLDPIIDEEVDCGSYVRRLLTYVATPGGRTPAYMCIPKVCLSKDSVSCPAVLCLHGTDNEVGHGTVVGLSQRENRSYAKELAERGFVTLAPSYPLLANYQLEPESQGFQSATMMAIWDNIRGLDYLDTLPFVAHRTPARHRNGSALPAEYYQFGNKEDPGSYQPGRYGAVGHSLGGHNSVRHTADKATVTCI
jgi:dienelactone hydrolase